MVRDYLKPVILKIANYKQFGAIPKSSTTLALLSMIHRWLSQTDGNGATIWIILFDYREAFDLTYHEILAGKLCSLDLPVSVVNWIIDFISDRYQTIKLANSGVYIGRAERGDHTPRTFLSENFELVGKFEGGYLTIFRLLRSRKTFRTRNVKIWTFVDHRNDTILR